VLPRPDVASCRDNVYQPLKHVRDEFFETFSSRASYSDFSVKDFEASKASLRRMLADFEKDIGGPAGSKEKGMALLLRHYEQELKTPIRNLFSGHLPRSALIQVRLPHSDCSRSHINSSHSFFSSCDNLGLVIELHAYCSGTQSPYVNPTNERQCSKARREL
jgi:hypothetical protein